MENCSSPPCNDRKFLCFPKMNSCSLCRRKLTNFRLPSSRRSYHGQCRSKNSKTKDVRKMCVRHVVLLKRPRLTSWCRSSVSTAASEKSPCKSFISSLAITLKEAYGTVFFDRFRPAWKFWAESKRVEIAWYALLPRWPGYKNHVWRRSMALMSPSSLGFTET